MLTDEEAMELMAKDVVIDIPIKHESKPYLMIPLPDGATNGDMIKALFPNAKYAECKNVIALHTEYFGVTHFDKEWWNASYKEGDKNGKGRDD